jgi:hypothetical protein
MVCGQEESETADTSYIIYIIFSRREDYLTSPGAEYEGLFNCDGVYV